MRPSIYLFLSPLVMACTPAADVTTFSGAVQFAQSTQNTEGLELPDTVALEVTVEGIGDFGRIVDDCEFTNAPGGFFSLYGGTAQVEANDYVISLTALDSYTWRDCFIPDLDVREVTEVWMRATIPGTSANCSSYCQAKAYAYADAQCAESTSGSACRTDNEGAYTTSCGDACEGSNRTITSESFLSPDALQAIDLDSVSGPELGDLPMNITFDRLQDGEATDVAEAP